MEIRRETETTAMYGDNSNVNVGVVDKDKSNNGDGGQLSEREITST